MFKLWPEWICSFDNSENAAACSQSCIGTSTPQRFCKGRGRQNPNMQVKPKPRTKIYSSTSTNISGFSELPLRKHYLCLNSEKGLHVFKGISSLYFARERKNKRFWKTNAVACRTVLTL